MTVSRIAARNTQNKTNNNMSAMNPWDTSGGQRMAIEEESGQIYSMPPVVDAVEAERLVEALKVFPIQEVGSYAWMEQHRNLERLNIQAHQCAMTNSDDYVTEALLTFQKLDVIIEELIVIEAWKEFVYPLVVSSIASKNAMRLYFVLYHEATLANLLEVIMYHKHAVRTAGEKWIDIVDYVARKLARVNGGYDFRSLDPSNGASAGTTAKEIAEAIASRTPQQEITQHLTEIEFRLCISACFIARFLCEHIDVLPISVHSRVTDTHDFLVLTIPCIENPPWTRRIPTTGKWQKVIDFKWTEVAPIDLLKVTKLEGQLWISLYYLISKREFRERYQLNSFRTAQLLRVRKYLNDTLLDQLPMLADIQRYMDELTIADASGGIAASRNALDASSLSANAYVMLQQVAAIRDKLVRGAKWEAVATHSVQNVFTMTDATDRDLKLIADVYADDLAEDVLEPLAAAATAGGLGDYEDC